MKIRAGAELLFHSGHRNWRLAKRVDNQCKVLAGPKGMGLIPLCYNKWPHASIPSEPGYKVIRETTLYEKIIDGQISIGRYEQPLSSADANFGFLWDAFRSGQFQEARKITRETGENPVLWVNVTYYDLLSGLSSCAGVCRINKVSTTTTIPDKSPGSYDIKFEILPPDYLLSPEPHPDLLHAVAMFNSILKSVKLEDARAASL